MSRETFIRRTSVSFRGLLPLLMVCQALLLSLAAHAWEEGELLPPEEAFRFSARAVDARTLEVRYAIADGYYLYRDKFAFKATPAILGEARFPAGKVKEDETFGRTEVYFHEVTIRLPLTDEAERIDLAVTSQGCADGRVCYSPMLSEASIDLPATTPAAVELFGNEFLSPEKAFRVEGEVLDGETVAVRLIPASGYYIYRDKVRFELKNTSGVRIREQFLPQGKTKDDPAFGPTEVFTTPVTANLLLDRGPSPTKLTLMVHLQGCAEQGVCYPPQTASLGLALPATDATDAAVARVADAAGSVSGGDRPEAGQPGQAGNDEAGSIAGLMSGGSFWLIVVSFFGFGLLLALTPCVFPMIPILSGIIVGQGKEVTKMQGFTLSAAYVLGMALTYAAAGVAAGMSGAMLSAALQNPWVLGSFALVFVALAFSMFGFYDLQLPAALQSRMSQASGRFRGGSFIGVFLMGALSAIIVGPCVAAPLAGALLYISQTHDVILGGVALFAMALGMGVPLLLVGLSAGALLPRAGGWMNAVKSFFGVLLLAVAIWLVSPVIPGWLHMALWAVLLIVSAMYLSALDPLPSHAGGWRRLWKGVGIVALLTGVALLVGLLAGGRDPLQPLSVLAGGGSGSTGAAEGHALAFERVMDSEDLDRRLAATDRPVMLDFYADWCVSCKEMDRFTFSDPGVQARLANVLLLQADVTANSEADKALLKRFQLFGPPGIVFFDARGQEVPGSRVVGYQAPERFQQSLDAAGLP